MVVCGPAQTAALLLEFIYLFISFFVCHPIRPYDHSDFIHMHENENEFKLFLFVCERGAAWCGAETASKEAKRRIQIHFECKFFVCDF